MKKLEFKRLVVMGYVLGIVAWMLLSKGLFLRQWGEIVGAIAGTWLGWQMVWFDKIAYVYILHPEVQLSQYVRHYVKAKNYKRAFGLLKVRESELSKLTTRSALFQVAWVVLAVFAVTSVPNLFGKMLLMSLGLRILLEEWEEYRKDKQKLKGWLFWQVKREISDKELKWYIYGMSGVFVWLTYLLA